MLDHQIEALFKKKADEVVFIELKEGKQYQYKSAILDHTMPLPLMIKYLIDQVKGISEADIQLKSIMEGMAFILGVDSAFPHKAQYMSFLREVDPDIVNSLQRLATRSVELEEYLEAAIYLKAAWEFDRDIEDALLLYARCLEWHARSRQVDSATEKILEDEAYEILLFLADRYPNKADVLYHIGFHLANRKSYKAAKDVWEKAVELGLHEEQQAEILENLTKLWSKIQFEEGYVLILDGFPDQGLLQLLPLEEDNPEWWNLMFFIGLAYRQKEDYDNAIYYYKKTLNLNTGHVDTFNEIGLCYMAMGIYHEAKGYFEEALRLRPENQEILCNLGIVHLKLGQMDDAKKLIHKAAQIDPQDDVTQAWLRYVQQL